MNQWLKDLNWKFGFLAVVMTLGIVLASQHLLMKQARAGMESRIAEKAAFINHYYAARIAEALQHNDDVSLQQDISQLEEDPEITSVIVVDANSEIRYHSDPQKLGTKWDDPLIQKAMETGDGVMSPFTDSGGRALALVSPLKVQGKPIPLGVVRIDLTYRHVSDQLSRFDNSFHMAVLGYISVSIGFILIFVRRWLIFPLTWIEQQVTALSLTASEPNLPETSDEFGQLAKALNDMLIRFRTQLQDQMGTGAANPLEIERDLVGRIMRTFFPKSLIFISDRDNRIIAGSKEALPAGARSDHVLDLITDKNFGNLVAAAFQKEGESAQGKINFHGKPFIAGILCVPAHESKLVKTLIVLQPDVQPEKGESPK
jgi:hypothetical protein